MKAQTVLALNDAEVSILRQALYFYSSTLNVGSIYRADVNNLHEQLNIAQESASLVQGMDLFREAHERLVEAVHALEYAAKAEQKQDFDTLVDSHSQVVASVYLVETIAKNRMRLGMKWQMEAARRQLAKG
ncbi:hypothetical protein UFOVP821_20 [uncultured Caudovirales phage]|uniref:Uncharacterized protein n=1 Tax=uncultured Caudovirales phage TaxID=2100421 RepID=A0A6J5P6S4_9CAUD|nr:hypothetical protein UFOVP821_20 [uncultured Caudovirales phage]